VLAVDKVRDLALLQLASIPYRATELKRGATLPGASGGERVPFGEFSHRVDNRPHGKFDEGLRALQREAMQDIDRGVFGTRAHDSRLGDIGNKECLAASPCQRSDRRLEPEPIGIGFDDRRAFDGEELAFERLPIRHDRGKIDGERAAGFSSERA